MAPWAFPRGPAGQAVSAFSPAKGYVTPSKQWGWGGWAEAGGWALAFARALQSLLQPTHKLGFLRIILESPLGLERYGRSLRALAPPWGSLEETSTHTTRLPPPLQAPRVSFL